MVCSLLARAWLPPVRSAEILQHLAACDRCVTPPGRLPLASGRAPTAPTKDTSNLGGRVVAWAFQPGSAAGRYFSSRPAPVRKVTLTTLGDRPFEQLFARMPLAPPDRRARRRPRRAAIRGTRAPRSDRRLHPARRRSPARRQAGAGDRGAASARRGAGGAGGAEGQERRRAAAPDPVALAALSRRRGAPSRAAAPTTAARPRARATGAAAPPGGAPATRWRGGPATDGAPGAAPAR